MSYQVIARKWRPKAFEELVGQSHVSQTLINALQNQRLHHALLFTGPRGTGKTSTARILAKALRCPHAQNFQPCNQCDECEDIAQGRSINVLEIDGASNNGVDAIRELRDTVGYMPSSGRYKLYIIDEVHMLSTSAFNALLKTLEEPPSHVVFVMATTEAHKIPNTILSRCQRFDFRRIPLKMISEHLQTICTRDGVQADKEALWALARQGDGSMRDAQSLLDQVITFTNGHLDAKTVTEVLGLTDRQLLLKTLQALIDRSPEQALDVIEQVFTAGYDPKIFAQDLLEELRNLLMLKVAGHKSEALVDLPPAEIEQMQSMSRHLSQEDIHLLFDMALKGAHDLPKSQDTRIVLEMLLMRMTQAPRICDLLHLQTSAATNSIPTPPIKKSMPSPPALKSGSPLPSEKPPSPPKNSQAQPTAQSAPPPPPPSPSPSHQPHEAWRDLVQRIQQVNGLAGSQLEHCFLAQMDNKNLHIGISPKMKFIYEKVISPEFQTQLLNYINTFWGPGHSLTVEMTEAQTHLSPKRLAEDKEAQRQKSIREKVQQHPLVQSTQKVFKTELKSIKEIK